MKKGERERARETDIFATIYMEEPLFRDRQLSFFYFINRAEPEPKVRVYKEKCCECFLCQIVRFCWN